MAGVINIGADNASDQYYRYKMPKLQARVRGPSTIRLLLSIGVDSVWHGPAAAHPSHCLTSAHWDPLSIVGQVEDSLSCFVFGMLRCMLCAD